MKFMADQPPTVALWHDAQNGALLFGFALSLVVALLCYVPVRRSSLVREALANPEALEQYRDRPELRT